MNPLASRRSRSVLLALAALALAAWSLAGFARDALVRLPAQRFAQRFTLDRRRALDVAAMHLERSPDGATAVVVDAALDDVRGSGPPANLDPASRALWLESAKSIGQELEGARELVFGAITLRPGRAQHRFLLGQLVQAAQARTHSTADSRQWIVPLTLAGSAAPGLDTIFTYLAGACLDRWPTLSVDQKRDAVPVLRRAMADPGFVSRSMLVAGTAIGRDEVLGLLPDQAPSLRAAYEALAHDGDVTRAAALRPRLDKALRVERDLGIAKIEERLAAGDLEGARSACQVWLLRSPADEFDDPAGRAQTARVLQLWPNDAAGAWRTDSRGELVRFFLNRREKDVRPEALVGATEALSAVPDTVRARVYLLAGDTAAADDILEKSGGAGSFEWMPYLVEVARGRLARSDAAGARAVLRGLAPAAVDGCDVLLLRRDIAAALGDEAETATVAERLKWLHRGSLPPEAWSASGSMSLCVDGKEANSQRLRVAVDADAAAIVGYGWNGGRGGSILVPKGSTLLSLPIPALSGRQIFSLRGEAGGPVTPGTVTVLSGS